MNENKKTSLLLSHYRALRPQAEAIKFNDRITPGLPDFVLVDEGQTWWCEAKQEDGELTHHQERRLTRLDVATRGRVLTVWYLKDGRVHIYSIDQQSQVIAPNLTRAAEMLHTLIAARA